MQCSYTESSYKSFLYHFCIALSSHQSERELEKQQNRILKDMIYSTLSDYTQSTQLLS